MASPRRIERLSSLIHARVAEVVQRDLRDPRLGFVTITGVELDREITTCKVRWSVLGDEDARRRTEAALQHARRYVQREVAAVLTTRQVPELRFEFDESIAGQIRIQQILDEVIHPAIPPTEAGQEPGEAAPGVPGPG